MKLVRFAFILLSILLLNLLRDRFGWEVAGYGFALLAIGTIYMAMEK